jgi:hypothetical protein
MGILAHTPQSREVLECACNAERPQFVAIPTCNSLNYHGCLANRPLIDPRKTVQTTINFDKPQIDYRRKVEVYPQPPKIGSLNPGMIARRRFAFAFGPVTHNPKPR